MTTSGFSDHAVSGTEIVRAALFKVGAGRAGESVPPNQINDGLFALNNLIKFIAAKQGRNLWRRDEVHLFLNPSQPNYLLGNKDTDAEWCLSSSFTNTQLTAAASSAATSLPVDSTAGMRAGDRLGLELTDGTRSWMSITSIDSATTLTVPAISGAASDNATVYTYTINTKEVIKVSTLVNGALSSGVTGITVDSTTGMADGDRFSYVATDDTTVFSKITTVTNGTVLVVPTTAKAIADNAVFNVYKTIVNQGTVVTALNGAASANDETLLLDSASSITPGDIISVGATDASLMWMAAKTVISSTLISIPPLASAASDDAVVTIYKLKPDRPLRILHARRQDGPTGNDIPIDIEAQEQFRDQPLKTTAGTPVFLSYKPSLVSGELSIWQPPNGIKMMVKMTVARPFENFDAGGNNPDIPQEWYLPLIWMLADEIEPEYRVISRGRAEAITMRAGQAWAWANEFDDDTGSFYLVPDD